MPGFLEVDLVADCGESVDGFYLNTLTAVDIATGAEEQNVVVYGVKGRGLGLGQQSRNLRSRLPFSLLGLDSDNGSEFINQNLYHYCQHEHITFFYSLPLL